MKNFNTLISKDVKELIGQVDLLKSYASAIKEQFNVDGQDIDNALKELENLQNQTNKVKKLLQDFHNSK